MRRVVVTGLGTVNALAHDVPGTFAALSANSFAILDSVSESGPSRLNQIGRS